MNNLIGQSLGRYHILEQLGEGGMAIVYKAHDTRLERDVAIKVIRTEKLTIETMGKTLKRFEREVKALAKLTHPNIVPITDYGEHDGKPYLVMPFLPGGTLKQQLKGKPLPWEDSVRLLIPIARALHYAHQQGIIHRDVKPSNILITQSGEPMLTDFGIAKILLDTEETADLTGTGMGVGTPEYMSPEQFQGKGVDARTDVYSLGVVLYEMITGRKPYQADTPAAVLVKQVTEALPRPRIFISGLPDDVEKLLLKTLAKNKEDRYQNIAEMVRVMESLFGHAKATTASLSMADEPKKSTSHIPDRHTVDTMATAIQDESSRDTLATVDLEKQDGEALSAQLSQDIALQQTTKQETKSPVGWIVIGIVALVIGLIVGISGWQEAQNVRAEVTAEAYRAQVAATEHMRLVHITETAQVIQAQATATEQAHMVQATATAQALSGLINSWDIVLSDSFTEDNNGWSTGDVDFDLWSGNKSISGGKIVWAVEQSKGFVTWDWPTTVETLADFYLSVEARRISGSVSAACYGLWYRGSGSEYYVYEACDDQTYMVSLHSEEDGWETLLGFETSNAIRPNQKNKLAVLGRGSNFYFYINDQLVNSLSNSRWSSGLVGIMIEMSEGDTGSFEFDNFVVRSP
ncbi:MAG: serine/threonine protein kinase [Chloroflexota bacterium]